MKLLAITTSCCHEIHEFITFARKSQKLKEKMHFGICYNNEAFKLYGDATQAQ